MIKNKNEESQPLNKNSVIKTKKGKEYNPYKIYLPENLELDKILQANPPNFKTCPKKYGNYRDSIAYILHLISALNYKKDLKFKVTKGFTSINKKVLIERVHEYRGYFEYLKEQNIVEEGTSYVPGKRSMGLKFTPKYQTKVKEDWITTPTLIKSLTTRKSRGDIIAKEQLDFITKWMNPDLRIDNREAIEVLNKKSTLTNASKEEVVQKFNQRYIVVDRIFNSNYQESIIVDTTGGRLHTPLTVLPKELRKSLSYAKKKLVNVDIVNSQPFLSLAFLDLDLFHNMEMDRLISDYNELYIPMYTTKNNITINYNSHITMLVKKVKTNSDKDDMIQYKESVIEGRYYEDFSKILIDKNLIPNEIMHIQDGEIRGREIRSYSKTATFRSLFSENSAHHYNEYVMAFKNCYPSVYEIFSLIKKGYHPTLACSLQRFESNLVLFNVCKGVAHENPELPLFTIHDSVATTQGNEEIVEEHFKYHTQSIMGIMPKFSREYWH